MEARLFPEGTIPEWTTPEWYAGRETAPHLEQEGHRERLLLSAKFVDDAISRGGRNVLDLGAGDGGLLSLVTPNTPGTAYGFDLQQTNVDAAKLRGVDVRLVDAVADDEWAEYVWSNSEDTVLVATEMLEHLVDPHAFVRLMHDSGARWLVASSPYIETAELHYEFHTWAWDLEGYRELLESNGWRVARQETSWISQVLLAERT